MACCPRESKSRVWASVRHNKQRSFCLSLFAVRPKPRSATLAVQPHPSTISAFTAQHRQSAVRARMALPNLPIPRELRDQIYGYLLTAHTQESQGTQTASAIPKISSLARVTSSTRRFSPSTAQFTMKLRSIFTRTTFSLSRALTGQASFKNNSVEQSATWCGHALSMRSMWPRCGTTQSVYISPRT